MNEATLRNESLGLSMTKATINGIDVVLAENVREALEWDSIPNMVCGLKDGKEVLKIRVSALKSAGWDFLKFKQNLQKGLKATGVRLLHHPSWCVSSQCRQYPHLGINCDASFKELSLNLVKTSENCGWHVENHIKWSIIYIVPHGVVTNTTARRQE